MPEAAMPARSRRNRPVVNAHFEIQGRLIEHRDGVRVRDDVRLARADTRDDAVRLADALRADGFTVWVYRVEPGCGTQPVYRTVDVLEPDPSPGPTADRTPARPAGSVIPRRATTDPHDPPLPIGCGVVRTEGDGAR